MPTTIEIVYRNRLSWMWAYIHWRWMWANYIYFKAIIIRIRISYFVIKCYVANIHKSMFYQQYFCGLDFFLYLHVYLHVTFIDIHVTFIYIYVTCYIHVTHTHLVCWMAVAINYEVSPHCSVDNLMIMCFIVRTVIVRSYL